MTEDKAKVTGHDHNSEEETTPLTEEEKFYNCLYTRRQYRTMFGQKCSKRVEMILDMKTDQLKKTPVVFSSGSASNSTNIHKLKQSLESCLSINKVMNVEEFYEHTISPVANVKEFMQNIDLKVQRLVRQAEEIKEVNSQLKRQEKEDDIYMILKGSTIV